MESIWLSCALRVIAISVSLLGLAGAAVLFIMGTKRTSPPFEPPPLETARWPHEDIRLENLLWHPESGTIAAVHRRATADEICVDAEGRGVWPEERWS